MAQSVWQISTMSVARSSTRDLSAPPSLAVHPDSLEQALKHLYPIEADSAEAYRTSWHPNFLGIVRLLEIILREAVRVDPGKQRLALGPFDIGYNTQVVAGIGNLASQ